MMALHTNLKRARTLAGMTQTDVAAKIGISNTALSNYETGYREPDLETLKQLAQCYSVSIDELADNESHPDDHVYDFWALSKQKKISFRGVTYELRDTQKQMLRRELTKIFERL